ncbi:c-type cytochrome biogenesis protein CcsB [Actinophytocola xinjiangensis]|uniref:C-type cytochrome biogenesis protein CcsB n=1 Tax=Actinophytocola xinjiangensis TaxID=485602 RepID=A0A7Z0WIR3_9PSEU|nr:c-type cytochrome biogenesis protein CcsB [Actinophytocola xinjiangensis]OLF07108.1 c-type cytochrome biogenesis protein CcsB [Actinophytocola xinjiangensis]
MPVNETLSTYSDWCYGAAVGVYVLAMLFSLIDQAFGRRVPKAVRRARERELVGAGGPVLTEDVPVTDDTDVRTDGPEPGERARRLGRMSVALTVLGATLHLVALVMRGVATERVPWGNMYEFGATLCLVAVITWLVVLRRFPIQHLSVWVLLPVIALMFLGGVVLYSDAAPVQPALQSYWLVIHVFSIALGSGMVLVPGVVSVLYLVKNSRLRVADRLPSADVLDRVAYRTTVLAFPIFTAGVIFGAIWAESAWGRFWDWDPKETVSFVAWIVYAAYLHARAVAGWRGKPAAMINIAGMATMIFNLFFINLVVAGLHSYAGG